MATIPYKLEDITSEYSLFIDNQVLTANQLNEIVHYFEDQQRLSRILLTGVGRVCGFELNWNPGVASIELSYGAGVTTDGDLMYLDHAHTFTRFKKYADDNARYPLFIQGESQYDLWELFESDVSDEEVPGLSNLGQFQAVTGVHPNNLAVILYIENFDKAPDICTKLDCDNLGKRQINNIHVLLIKRTDLDQIISQNDTLFQTCRKAGNHFFDLPVISAPRVILTTSRTSTFTNLAKAYVNAIQDQSGALQAALTTLSNGFKWLLDPENKTSDALLQNRLTQVFITETTTPDLDIQYRYDLFKDVIATYSELRTILWDLCMNCCPDTRAFPKHLMVRELVVTDSRQAQYRHGFYPSPAVAQIKSDLIQKSRTLYQRLVSLIFGYRKRLNQPVKITPSNMPPVPLGERAIPYYLDPEIHKVWNAQNMRYLRHKEHLSYLADTYGDTDSVKRPLLYNIDGHDFFRIEGHIGHSFNAAITEISNQINQHQLPVEVIGLRLGDVADSIDINEYECWFEDLLVILNAWQEEQKCIWSAISKFFSGFNLKSAETHIEYGTRVSGAGKAAIASDAKTGISKATPGIDKIELNETSGKTAYRAADFGMLEYRYAGNPIGDNLVKEQDYIGIVLDQVIKNNAAASYAEIKDITISEISKIPEVSEWEPAIVEMAVNIPVNLLAMAFDVNRIRPVDIQELNVEVLDRFQISMQRICQNIKTWQSAIGKQFSAKNYVKVGYEDRYLQLLSQVAVNCCAADKLKILREEIERRKLKILEMTMLSNYLGKHPGMEHLAGVPRGGTFILVYKSPTQAGRDTILVRESAGRDAFLKEMAALTTRSSKSEAVRETSISTLSVADRRAVSGIEELLAVGSNIPVGDYQVVADFALPYLCCSDCPPMSFIVPKERVSLIIPDHICYVKGMNPVPITVIPADGEVKADQGENLVYTNEAGQWVFDPERLPSTLFGAFIGFTVNDQITNAKTIVFHKPQPAISLERIECITGKNVAIATFRNNTPLIDGVTFGYEWNFGDGSIESNNSLVVTHLYQGIKPGEKMNFGVTLKATNSMCVSSTAPLPVEILCQPDIPDQPVCLEIARDNYSKFREMFSALKPGDSQNIQELHKLTAEVFKIVDSDFDKVYAGAFNANLFPQLITLINDTMKMMVELKDEGGILSQLFRIQLMLLLSILRCQDLNITENERVLFDFFSRLAEMIGRLIEMGFDVDSDGYLAEYLSAYLDAMESERGILESVLKKVLDLLKN